MTSSPVEVTTVLGIGLGFIALVFVLFLYVSKIRCFSTSPSFLSFEDHLIPESTYHRIRSRFAYDGHNSSDSEDETIRRMQLQPCDKMLNRLSGNHANGTKDDPISHFNSIHKILSCKNGSSTDPLAMAEGGKVGIINSCNDSSYSEANLAAPIKISIDAQKNILSYAAILPYANNTECKTKTKLLLPELTKENDERALRWQLKTASNPSILKENISGENDSHPETINRKNKIYVEEATAALTAVNCEHASLQEHNSLDEDSSLNNDCILVLSQERLYDTSDIKSLKSDLDNTVSALESPLPTTNSNGCLEIALLYDAPMRKMTVHVLQAKGIASRSDKGQLTHTQVRFLMLPSKKQKHKTKIRSGENPQFMESFLLHRVNPEEVNSMGLRIRVYGCERMRRERLIGETIVSFANIDLELETNLWLQLEPRGSSTDTTSTSDLLSITRSDSTGSTSSMQHGGVPELLLGLGYNGITGRLTVEIVKGSYFRNHYLSKVPDTYVKMCLVSSMGHEIARAKTSTRRGQPNPLFKETFIFQVALFQLNDVTLIISVYAKRNMKRNEMVGWFSMGLNSSGPEEMTHWNEVRGTCSRSELITRWHVLVDS
ncbi:synaptotagmin-14-like isoform X2 [Anopheles albimanus]|uniref:synaptotagmin-14-like isoform X2 n=1 Tax=Anopheles albimanus TaxID=7167 RepID=UPI001640AF0D|nr:synaptotagmin-14-like isoform X2 [Anopheles albimanus]